MTWDKTEANAAARPNVRFRRKGLLDRSPHGQDWSGKWDSPPADKVEVRRMGTDEGRGEPVRDARTITAARVHKRGAPFLLIAHSLTG